MTTHRKIAPEEIDRIELETLKSIQQGQKEKVKKLYLKVENLFSKGSEQTRTLIANKFIYPLSLLLEMNYSWGREYLNMFPAGLKAEYHRQIYSSGI